MRRRLITAFTVFAAIWSMITAFGLDPTAQAALTPQLWVSPAGGGNGSSSSSPLTLAQAIVANGPAKPGMTVWLSGGTYRGCANSTVAGTPTAPIVFRSAPGASVTLDGASCTDDAVLRVMGADTWWQGLEVMNSNPNRYSTEPGSNPVSYKRPAGIGVYGPRTHILDCWAHDNGNGVGLWSQAVDAVLSGCVITNNGWEAPDRGHGHGLYIQNESGIKRITDTYVSGSYDIGVQGYGAAGRVQGLRFDGLLAVNNGGTGINRAANFYLGASSAVDDVQVARSAFYQPAGVVGGSVRLGAGTANGSVALTNSYLANGAQDLEVVNWSSVNVTGNTFYNTASANSNANAVLANVSLNSGATWGSNTYYSSATTGSFFYNKTTGADGGGQLQFADWRRNSGFDSSSSFTRSLPAPTAIVTPATQGAQTQFVTLMNWNNQPSMAVDLKRLGFVAGDSFELHPTSNPRQTAVSGVYNGVTAPLPTSGQSTTWIVTRATATATPPTRESSLRSSSQVGITSPAGWSLTLTTASAQPSVTTQTAGEVLAADSPAVASTPTDEPSAAVDEPTMRIITTVSAASSLYCFGTAPDGTYWWGTRTSAGWSGWQPLAGPLA